MVDSDVILRTADLARLAPDPADRARLGAQLEKILGYIEQLAEVDTRNVPPMMHAAAAADVFRADEPDPGDLDVEGVLDAAPERRDRYFLVPRTVRDS